MTNPGPNQSPAATNRISQICSRFQAAWNEGNSPRIEALLAAIDESHQPQLLKALLQIEVEYRSRTGSHVQRDELLQRFPDHISVVDSIFSEPGITDSIVTQETHYAGSPVTKGSGTDNLPATIGRYKVKSLLGEGAMGSVYLAIDPNLNREVAVKCPHPWMQRDKVMLERFRREAQTAASLQHPNICPIHEIGEINGMPFFCMGYVKGRSLQSFVGAAGGLNERQIANVILRIARALEAAHAKDVVHRDLKPGNIIINMAGEPILMDFGIAQRMGAGDARLTATGQSIGSPAYMSPEQVEGDPSRIGPQTDVYSLGVILYEMLTGAPPFTGSVGVIMAQILCEEPPLPSKIRPEISVRLENICTKMIKKDKTKRYPSMSAVSEALVEFLKRTAPKSEQPKPQEPAKPVPGITRARQSKGHIEDLVKAGQYAAAIRKLEQLAADSDETVQELAHWAAAEIPKIRKQRQVIKQGRQDIFDTARDLVKKHDYESAIEVLEGYPADLRTPKMSELLDLAIDRSEEATLLLEDINSAKRSKQLDGLLPNIDRYLELKPGNRRVLALREQLTAKSSFAPSQVVFGSRPKSFRGVPIWVEWTGLSLAVFGIVLFVMTPLVRNYLNSSDDTVKDDDPAGEAPAVPEPNPFGGEPRRLPEKKVAESNLLKAKFGMTFRKIPAGTFEMGSHRSASELKDDFGADAYEDEFPKHTVQITRSFYMLTTEVTQKMWQSVMGTTPWKGELHVREGDDFPASYVSYTDAIEFCAKLSQRGDGFYRLPTEAEWEYACRAGTTTDFSTGNDVKDLKESEWFGQLSAAPREVGESQENDFGLFDMHGNVSEWCLDRYTSTFYDVAPEKDPAGPEFGNIRVARGGHWQCSARRCRSSRRGAFGAGHESDFLGFRIVKVDATDAALLKSRRENARNKADEPKPRRSPDPRRMDPSDDLKRPRPDVPIRPPTKKTPGRRSIGGAGRVR